MDLHETVWQKIVKHHTGLDLTKDQWEHRFVGRTNTEIWPELLGHPVDAAEVYRLGEEKEATYREVLLSLPDRVTLVDGAIELFETCLANGIKIGIGTAANRTNVDFYIETFGLHRWFKPDCIVFDDGTMPGKPHPALFSTAIGHLGVAPEKCIVVEDGVLGIRAARAAGAGKVYGIWSDPHGKEKLASVPLDRVIHTYREMSLEDFS